MLLLNITKANNQFIKWALLICAVWSVPVYAEPGPGYCSPVMVNTRYESVAEHGNKILTGVESKGLIGIIHGSFNFTCRTHTSYPDGKTTLGIYFAGSGKSYDFGGPTEATYKSNIDGIILKLPPQRDISSDLSEGSGMISGKYAGESNAIMLERYTLQAGYSVRFPFDRGYDIPLFYVYQTKPISLTAYNKQRLWTRYPIRFATYLHEGISASSRNDILQMQGPEVIFYDQGCKSVIPDRVEFGSVAISTYEYRDFKIAVQCPKSEFTVAPDIKIRFEVIDSPFVEHSSSNFPTYATYIKDGMDVNLQLVDQNSDNIVFGRDIVYRSSGSGNYVEVPFKAEIASTSRSSLGKFEFNIGVSLEYN